MLRVVAVLAIFLGSRLTIFRIVVIGELLRQAKQFAHFKVIPPYGLSIITNLYEVLKSVILTLVLVPTSPTVALDILPLPYHIAAICLLDFCALVGLFMSFKFFSESVPLT